MLNLYLKPNILSCLKTTTTNSCILYFRYWNAIRIISQLLPFIALVSIICNREWRNDENYDRFSESGAKIVHILCDPLVTVRGEKSEHLLNNNLLSKFSFDNKTFSYLNTKMRYKRDSPATLLQPEFAYQICTTNSARIWWRPTIKTIKDETHKKRSSVSIWCWINRFFVYGCFSFITLTTHIINFSLVNLGVLSW